MLAITVLQRFLSVILAPTPFADPFLSASSSFAPLQALIVTGTLATPLIPAVTATAVDVKEDPQETLVVTDMYETPRFYAPFPSLDPPPTLSVRFATDLRIPAIVISTSEEESQDLSVYEEDDGFWELSSDEGSDITSTPSSVTSDDMVEELKGFCTFHANVSIENIQLYPDEDDCVQNDEDPSNSHETDVPALPACTALSTFVASAIPRRVYDALQEEKADVSTPELLQITPGSIDDLDEIVNFNIRWLTPRALGSPRGA